MDTNTICPNCKLPVEQGATFCGNCGHKLEVSQPQPVTISPSVSPNVLPIGQPQVNQAPVVNGTAPAYSIGQPESKAEKTSIIALVIGIVGIPASLVPIAGIVLGVAGLALGTTARVKYKHTLNLLAIIFSSLAILISLGLWVASISGSHSYPQSGPFETISNACFSVKVDTGLEDYKHNVCTFNTSDKTEQFAVEGLKNKAITQSNLPGIAASSLAAQASLSKGKITNGHAGTFAGSSAYIADFSSTNGSGSGIFAFVDHPTPNGDNIFIIGRAVTGPGLDSFGSLETTWQWK